MLRLMNMAGSYVIIDDAKTLVSMRLLSCKFLLYVYVCKFVIVM